MITGKRKTHKQDYVGRILKVVSVSIATLSHLSNLQMIKHFIENTVMDMQVSKVTMCLNSSTIFQ